MKVSVLLIFLLGLQSCLPATIREANVCDGLPTVKEGSSLVNEEGEEQPAAAKTEKADKTLMMYRLLHAF